MPQTKHAHQTEPKSGRNTMNRWIRCKTSALALALAVVGWAANTAQATNPATLNIDVTIGGSVSVVVNGGASSTTYVTWTPSGRELVATSTVDVQNNSGGLSEQWELKTNAATTDLADQGSPDTWGLVVSTEPADVGADKFALQAVFVSSAAAADACTAAVGNPDGYWKGATSSLSRVTASDLVYGTGASNNQFAFASDATGTPYPDNKGAQKMFNFNATTGAGHRGLCWKVIGPTTVSGNNSQQIVLTITAL